MLANVDNVRVTQSARITLNGQVVPVHQVIYTISDQGPYNDNFPDTLFTPQNVFNAQAARIVKLYQLGVSLPYPPKQLAPNSKTWTIPILANPTAAGGSTSALAQTGTFTYTEP